MKALIAGFISGLILLLLVGIILITYQNHKKDVTSLNSQIKKAIDQYERDQEIKGYYQNPEDWNWTFYGSTCLPALSFKDNDEDVIPKKDNKKSYEYFVSYRATSNDPTRLFEFDGRYDEEFYSWSTIVRENPIKNGKDLKDIVKLLEKKNDCRNLVILNWKKMEGDDVLKNPVGDKKWKVFFDRANSKYEWSDKAPFGDGITDTDNDFDPDRLAGDTTDD